MASLLNSPQVDSSFAKSLYYALFTPTGQVAQLVERGPEKAGVGGSIPSLATIFQYPSLIQKLSEKISRAYKNRASVASTSLLDSPPIALLPSPRAFFGKPFHCLRVSGPSRGLLDNRVNLAPDENRHARQVKPQHQNDDRSQ